MTHVSFSSLLSESRLQRVGSEITHCSPEKCLNTCLTVTGLFGPHDLNTFLSQGFLCDNTLREPICLRYPLTQERITVLNGSNISIRESQNHLGWKSPPGSSSPTFD